MPEVSVILPTYNARRYVRETIESILCQTLTDFELIVIDDGSTDGTFDVVEELATRDARIHLYSQPNRGNSHSLNRGLALARSDFVAIMNHDDLMLPNRLERQLQFMRTHDRAAAVSSYVYYINESGKLIGTYTSPYTDVSVVRQAVSANIPIGFHHPAAMLRKSIVESVGGYRQEYWPADDLDLWNRIVETSSTVLVQPEFLIKYRIHSTAFSSSHHRLMLTKTRFVKYAMIARRSGEREPTWDEFLRYDKARPGLVRLQQSISDLANISYKQAATHYANRSWIPFILHLIIAGILRPSTIRRAIGKSRQHTNHPLTNNI